MSYIDPEKFIENLEKRIAAIKNDPGYDPTSATIGAAVLGMEQRLQSAKDAQRRRLAASGQGGQ